MGRRQRRPQLVSEPGGDRPWHQTKVVTAQLVGHETHGFLSLPLQASSTEFPRRAAISAGLDEEGDQVPILIHGAPQILAHTVDRDEDFVQKSRVPESPLSVPQPTSVVRTELPAPFSNSFVRHDDASLGTQILDIPEAQADVASEHRAEIDGRSTPQIRIVAIEPAQRVGAAHFEQVAQERPLCVHLA